MALKLPITINFPISFDPTRGRSSTELRFSRSDDPNSDNHRHRHRRRPSTPDADQPSPAVPTSRSAPNDVDSHSHPAFRFSNIPKSKPRSIRAPHEKVKIGDDGVSYVIDGAPFEFKYSYTETPKVKPLKIREAPFVPFGPTTMPRPWTGRAPLPASKKKLKEFDSFVLPPPNKKGVKPVQSPGPFLPGTRPRYVHSREEILGEPLTPQEIHDLVKSCIKSNRQLHIGRDGLTHNMLDNIHAHWKRRRVCKIKCIGVCTVDMDNVCQQLEEKTGGKVIYRTGGVLFLFRGRNYNDKTRPRFPLMLWKPVAPVYPRLVQRVPEGLTLEEATEMRRKGRQLIPICKLGKNGVYCDLVKNVREAFEECELVRINCQGLNKSDYRRIGGKLKDLVPCTLLSFENDHILMCRGRDWKSSFPNVGDDHKGANDENHKTLPSVEISVPCLPENSLENISNLSPDTRIPSSSSEATLEKAQVMFSTGNSKLTMTTDTNASSLSSTSELENENDIRDSCGEPEPCGSISPGRTIPDHSHHAKYCTEAESDNSRGIEDMVDSERCSDDLSASILESDVMLGASDTYLDNKVDHHADKLLDGSEAKDVSQPSRSAQSRTGAILSLLEQAVEKGSALILDGDSLDADDIYQATVTFAKSAPPGPIFRKRKTVAVKKSEGPESSTSMTKATVTAPVRAKRETSPKTPRKETFDELFLNVVPQGTLGVDELAKLLT